MLLVAAALLSVALCGVYLQLARRWQIHAQPNARSAHQLPTPSGGGVAVVLALFLSQCIAAFMGQQWELTFFYISGLALLLCLVGVVDDIVDLSVRWRLLIYVVIASIVCIVLQSQSQLTENVYWSIEWLVAVLGVLWLMNLFNFMDGIDGLAATQAFLASAAVSLLSWQYGGTSTYALYCALVAMCYLGFLVWNWQPAKLFMGDAGSVPGGFLLSALALSGAWQEIVPLGCWLILLAVFIVDATYTLLWRIVTGQRFMQAHNLHAYQCLSRHWSSHQKVVCLMIVVCVLWLLPLATLTFVWRDHQWGLVILAYVPLVITRVKLRQSVT